MSPREGWPGCCRCRQGSGTSTQRRRVDKSGHPHADKTWGPLLVHKKTRLVLIKELFGMVGMRHFYIDFDFISELKRNFLIQSPLYFPGNIIFDHNCQEVCHLISRQK